MKKTGFTLSELFMVIALIALVCAPVVQARPEVINDLVTFDSGATLNMKGTLKIQDVTVTATAAEMNALTTILTRLTAIESFSDDGILSQGGLAIAGNTNAFATASTIYYTIGGVQYTKAATTNIAFTTANTINLAASTNSAFYGAWLVEIDAAGTFATKPAGGLTNQVYTTSAAATAALPSATAASVPIGTISVAVAAGSTFTANTTGMNTNSTTFANTAVKVQP